MKAQVHILDCSLRRLFSSAVTNLDLDRFSSVIKKAMKWTQKTQGFSLTIENMNLGHNEVQGDKC